MRRFDVEVPETAVGTQNVVAVGLDAAGRLVAVSDTVNVEVSVPSALNSITVYPPVVYLRPCGRRRWRSPGTTRTAWRATCPSSPVSA